MTPTLTALYHQAPVWLQNAVISAYGLRLRRVRYGALHAATSRMLETSQWLPAAAIERNQLSSLNAALTHARDTVPFYQDASSWPRLPLRALAELRSIPILQKSDLQAAGKAVVSTAYASRRLEEVHTGGSTGTPLTIYCDSPTLQRNYAFFSRFLDWARIPVGARTATFAGRVLLRADAGPPYWRRNRPANTTLFSSYHISPATLPEYVDELARVSPLLIDSYPSSMEPVARHLLATDDRRVRPRAVVTSSETLLPHVRREIEMAFGCKVFDHYGSAEMVSFVTQCEMGTYHVNPEFGVLELLKNGEPVAPGEPGEIVATGFINPVMPLVRYAMGDWAIWQEGPCACGRAMPALKEIGGRIDDVLSTPEGRLVGRIDPIFKAVASMFECRIVQDAADHIRVEIVSREPVPVQEQSTLISALRDRLGSTMRIDIVRVEHIPRTERGKLRAVVNEWRSRSG